jgi:hypothetical protein
MLWLKSSKADRAGVANPVKRINEVQTVAVKK